MKLTKKEWILGVFTLGYVGAFALYYISIQNFEFLWYIAVVLFFIGLIGFMQSRTQFSYPLLWALSIWGLLHMAGGGIVVRGGVLYALPLFHLWGQGESFILKYDQVVHFYGFGVATYAVYHLIRPYLNENTRWGVIYFILVAAGVGLGAFNEIVEFLAVLTFSETGVGGYYNTSLDLVFNTLGALSAVGFIHYVRTKNK